MTETIEPQERTEHKSLAEALLALQADPPLLTKNKDGQVGNQRTKYADLVQVNDQVLSRLNQLGLIWTCCPTVTDDGLRCVLDYQLLHVASGEKLGGRYPIKGENPQQQGSAITYARRYALLAVTGIAAEDEDDDGAGGGRKATTVSRRDRTAKTDPDAVAVQRGGDQLTDGQRRKLYACLRDAGAGEREPGLALTGRILGREVESTNDLTKREAAQVIDHLEKAGGGQ